MLSMPQTKVQHNLDAKTQGSALHMQHLLHTHTSPAAVAYPIFPYPWACGGFSLGL